MTMQEVRPHPKAAWNGQPKEAGRPEPDDRPGFYYVTIRDGPRHGLLAGPYEDDHPKALAMVPLVRRLAHEANAGQAAFAAFGTSWSPVDQGPGVLNDQLAELLKEQEEQRDEPS